MDNYYTALQIRSHAFLLERRLKDGGVECELAFMPRTIMKELCNMGVRFGGTELQRAVSIIKRSGLPGCKLYREILSPSTSTYEEVCF